ncbi:MAG: hypothetical protein QF886_21330, partial [Planctomycetota bacterium]|nr:hypothetical protein [Planctomycetota bacterium]
AGALAGKAMKYTTKGAMKAKKAFRMNRDDLSSLTNTITFSPFLPFSNSCGRQEEGTAHHQRQRQIHHRTFHHGAIWFTARKNRIC